MHLVYPFPQILHNHLFPISIGYICSHFMVYLKWWFRELEDGGIVSAVVYEIQTLQQW